MFSTSWLLRNAELFVPSSHSHQLHRAFGVSEFNRDTWFNLTSTTTISAIRWGNACSCLTLLLLSWLRFHSHPIWNGQFLKMRGTSRGYILFHDDGRGVVELKMIQKYDTTEFIMDLFARPFKNDRPSLLQPPWLD